MDFISPGPRSLKVVDIPNIDTRCQSSNKQQHANVHGCLKFHNIIVLSCLPSFNLNVRKGKKRMETDQEPYAGDTEEDARVQIQAMIDVLKCKVFSCT